MDRWELPWAIAGPTDGGRQLWVTEGLLTTEPVTGAEQLPGRFALPGLVDAHFHMALAYGGVRVSREDAYATLRANVDQGVLLVRELGAPDGITLNLPADQDLPRVIAAGQHLAVPGGFIAGSHDPVLPERLVEAALSEIDKGATWVKVMGDAGEGPPPYPMETIRQMSDAVHARGARVAVHTEGPIVRELVHAGVDSIEHGSSLDEDTLHEMARLGIAWTPTTNLYVRDLEELDKTLARTDLEPDRRKRVEGYRQHVEDVIRGVNELLAIAASLGVTLLASTDTVGTVVDDVETMAAAGVDPAVAVGAASWDARRYLGAPSLEDGAPADVVTFNEDPRADPNVLHHPVAVLLGGRRVR